MSKTRLTSNVWLWLAVTLSSSAAIAQSVCREPPEAGEEDWVYVDVDGPDSWGPKDCLRYAKTYEEILKTKAPCAYEAGDHCFFISVQQSQQDVWVRLDHAKYSGDTEQVDRVRSRRLEAPYLYKACPLLSGTATEGIRYVLEDNDGPKSVAHKFRIPVAALIAANPDAKWRRGTSVLIPFAHEVTAGKGDNPSKIAASFGLTVRRALKFNDKARDGQVLVGETLIMPPNVADDASSTDLELDKDLRKGLMRALPGGDDERVLLATTTRDDKPSPKLVVDVLGDLVAVREVRGVTADATVVAGEVVSIREDPGTAVLVRDAVNRPLPCTECPKLAERSFH